MSDLPLTLYASDSDQFDVAALAGRLRLVQETLNLSRAQAVQDREPNDPESITLRNDGQGSRNVVFSTQDESIEIGIGIESSKATYANRQYLHVRYHTQMNPWQIEVDESEALASAIPGVDLDRDQLDAFVQALITSVDDLALRLREFPRWQNDTKYWDYDTSNGLQMEAKRPFYQMANHIACLMIAEDPELIKKLEPTLMIKTGKPFTEPYARVNIFDGESVELDALTRKALDGLSNIFPAIGVLSGNLESGYHVGPVDDVMIHLEAPENLLDALKTLRAIPELVGSAINPELLNRSRSATKL